jgi:hypothetical protein
MENTIENKAKFFAQYWGQKVLTRPESANRKLILGDEVSIQSALSKFGYNYKYFLELKPLSLITDEQAFEIAKILKVELNPKNVIEFIHISIKKYIENDYKGIDSHVLDFLRSKGYALPYMSLSVEKQIEYGWIKLKS